MSANGFKTGLALRQNGYSKAFCAKLVRATAKPGVVGFFVFLSTLFLGADIFGFSIAGLNVRVDQFFLVIAAALLLLRRSYRLKVPFWAWALLCLGLVSSVFAVSAIRALAFTVSLLFNLVFIFALYASYIRTYGFRPFVKMLRATFILQAVLLWLQFLLKVALKIEIPFMPSYGEYLGIPRFSLWFYEPSYLVTYFIFWYSLAIYMLLVKKAKRYFLDVLLGLSCFLIATSTTGLVGVVAVTVIAFLISFFKGITLRKIIILGLVVIAGVAVFVAFKSVFMVFVGRLFEGNLDTASGGRIGQWAESFSVFLSHPFLGVGPGCYGLYVANDTTVVPSNVTLELMATLGVLAPVFFYGLTIYLTVIGVKAAKRYREPELFGAVIGLWAFTVILQVNQGYLRLYHWMIFGLVYGAALDVRKRGREELALYSWLAANRQKETEIV